MSARFRPSRTAAFWVRKPPRASRSRLLRTVLLLALCCACSTAADTRSPKVEAAPSQAADEAADDTIAQGALARLPVKEVTIFKDGHAFMLHEGALPTDEHGRVHLDALPQPVIGTFWPYSLQKDAPLASVVAGVQTVRFEKTALQVHELLESNVGAKVWITQGTPDGEKTYAATIEGVPARSTQELASLQPPDAPPPAQVEKGNLILLSTAEGLKATPINTIIDVTFAEPPRRKISFEEQRHLLTLNLQWPNDKPAESADVGMMYLQRGIRWIPGYKVTIDGQNKARVQLQATLLNELTDLRKVTAHLVVGVPNFDFKSTLDPIALSGGVVPLSQYFQEPSQTAHAFSNAMMTQVARMGEQRNMQPAGQPAANLGPELPGGGKQEDLYIFTVKELSLKRGERMVVPIVEFEVPYENVYTLRLPYAPPIEVRRSFNNTQQAELAKLFSRPKVQHHVRLTNNSPYPLTTGPAMIVKDNRLLGQGLMTYAAPNARTDLEITSAVDIAVHKSEEETGRTPAARQWGGNSYDRVDLKGVITLTNYRDQPIKIEVERQVLGEVSEAGEGQVQRLHGDDDWDPAAYPYWWGWYSWPYWWSQLNGMSRIAWKIELDPGSATDLTYQWHYYWRN